jgi:isoamylase
MVNWEAAEGAPLPLGVTHLPLEGAYNFALYTRHATGVTLLLYDAQDFVNPVRQFKLDFLRNKSSRVWHCRVPEQEVAACKYYAYSVEGPLDPANGHRFDSKKILLDPYSRGVFFPPAFNRDAAKGPGSNAGKAPLGCLPATSNFDWGAQRRPRHTSDLIIYEMHVKGFTMRPNSGVAADKRGTYLGVIEKIPYLKELGVTAVELLPVYQYEPEEGGNYWGYMPLSFFSPHRGYSHAPEAAGLLDEFRAMVKALHEADIEVILDVVYNHTTERDERGPTYSYRGIDNSTYYLLEPDMRKYRDDAGTGNVLRTAYPNVRQLVVDSLRFWAKEMHVDGFRFDLASIFSRNNDGSINTEDPPIIAEISLDPDLADVRLIAEAWDLGAYQLGRSFPGLTWFQWNGKFRDEVRAFVKSDPGLVGRLMARLYGSDDLFPDRLEFACHPYQSINYINSHDGFSLYDLVSYNRKHNEANGQHNTDGTNDNLSWNCGVEGDSHVPPNVSELRRRQVKNFCCLLLLANGTPMFCAGDEFMNTQRGNNNPYNQDNETTWLDWDLRQQNGDIFRFFQRMIAFRKAHPSLGRSRFWRQDVTWYGTGASVDMSYDSHTLACCVRGGSQQDDDIYVMVNAYWQDLQFNLQEGTAGDWKRVIDTGLPGPDDFKAPGEEVALQGLAYTVKSRSIVVCRRRAA